ncbi:DUF5103 domain-containing protein [Flavobacterium tegetincola]|uniref:type IX secretion system plug protein n=1 Tax=Flavobacterium tegetincola TaxID=150172 RepID=UPI0004299019
MITQNRASFFMIWIIILPVLLHAQIAEVIPPYNIKTATFVQNGENVVPVFNLRDGFQFEFDDLYGDEANYFYTLKHCDYNWNESELSKAEYIDGFDDQRIQTYENSFNTLQLYSHYTLSFPNKFTRLKVTGNYILSILNNSKEVVFSRKFIVYENLVSVPMQVKRPRTTQYLDSKQNLEFSIKSELIQFQNPLQNVKIKLIQNGNFNTAIKNVKPMFTIGNDLIYKYDAETQFWGGNEFLNFYNRDIRAANNTIALVRSNETYNSILHTNNARRNSIYTYFPDLNGNFIVRDINSENHSIEADYAWVFFSLSAPEYFGKKDIYITGMFENYALSEENKMEYNEKKNLYEKAIFIKQGFVNYQYQIADKKGVIDHENAIDGNFQQTLNDYLALVYYRENGERYDRVIGKGSTTSEFVTN